MAASLVQLPEELILAIISCLEGINKGHVESWKIPAVYQEALHSPMKQLSLVSKLFHRLIKPLLFSHFVISVPPKSIVCTKDNRSPTRRSRDALGESGRAVEAYVSRHRISKPVDTLTLLVDPLLADQGVGLRNPAQHSTDLLTMNEFWRRLLSVFDPSTLRIIAPVSVLGWLMSGEVHVQDAWAFRDMRTQMIELKQLPHIKGSTHTPRNSSSKDAPPRLPSPTTDTRTLAWDTNYLFTSRPWTHIILKEGSLLRAYGTYEYHNLQPPSILPILALPRTHTLTTLTLSTLYPFTTNLSPQTLTNLCKYTCLDLTFTPQKGDTVLEDNSDILGRADLGDCWSEVEQIYRNLFLRHGDHGVHSSGLFWRTECRLNSFVSGDYGVESVRCILDEGFERLQQSGWYRDDDGVKGKGWGKWVLDQIGSREGGS